MPGHNVLTLDLGSWTGWCEGHLDGVPRYGVWKLRDKERVDRARALRDLLFDRFEGPDRPVEVVFESPLHRGQQRGEAQVRLAHSLVAHVEACCRDFNITFYESHVQSTRKAVLGRGHFKAGTAKQAVAEFCASQGWEPADDNAADALVLWFHTLKVRFPGRELPRGAQSLLRNPRLIQRPADLNDESPHELPMARARAHLGGFR